MNPPAAHLGKKMDVAGLEDADLNVLLAVAKLFGSDDYRFPSAHKSRRDHDILAGLVVSEELKRCLGNDPHVIAAAVREKKINLKPAQIRDYFRGRFTPGVDVIGRIANAFAFSELRALSKMPWRLLSDDTLGLREIEKDYRLVSDGALKRVKTGRQPKRMRCRNILFDFVSGENCLNAPGSPEKFWQPLAAFRVALASGDWYGVNENYWTVIANLPSLASRPAVIPHVERLYSCVRILTRRIDLQFLWFSVNWDIVRDAIERADLGPTCKFKPFRNVFKGNDMHLGQAFPITDVHRELERRYLQPDIGSHDKRLIGFQILRGDLRSRRNIR